MRYFEPRHASPDSTAFSSLRKSTGCQQNRPFPIVVSKREKTKTDIDFELNCNASAHDVAVEWRLFVLLYEHGFNESVELERIQSDGG